MPPGDPLPHPRSRAALTPGSPRLLRTQDRAPAQGTERSEPEGEGGRAGRTSAAERGPERARGSLSARLPHLVKDSGRSWAPPSSSRSGKTANAHERQEHRRSEGAGLGSNPRGTGTHGTQAGLSPRGTQAAPVRSRQTDTRAGVCVSSVCATPSPGELRKKAHVGSDSQKPH